MNRQHRLIWSLALFPLAAGAGDEILVGRYAALRAYPTPEQVTPLATVVTVTFPAHVRTVGEAVIHLLQRSGYRYAPGPDEAAPLRALPLPAVHRRLGPLPLATALATLGGESYQLLYDSPRRLVAYARHADGETIPAPAVPPPACDRGCRP